MVDHTKILLVTNGHAPESALLGVWALKKSSVVAASLNVAGQIGQSLPSEQVSNEVTVKRLLSVFHIKSGHDLGFLPGLGANGWSTITTSEQHIHQFTSPQKTLKIIKTLKEHLLYR